eukprot:m51a1_g3361 putative tyrosine-protein phosphatase auxilin-like (656) ;mRNA; r:439603-441842
MSFEKIVRRTAQRVLQTIGIADKSYDEEFKAAQTEFTVLGEQMTEIRGDVRTCLHALQAFAGSVQTLALHARAAESTMGALVPLLSASTGEGSESAATQALQRSLGLGFESAHRVATELVAATAMAIQQASLNQMAQDEELGRETAAIMERRRVAQLDFDALRRTAAPAGGQQALRAHEERVAQAKSKFENASQAAVEHLQSRALLRASAIISSFSVASEELERFYQQSAASVKPAAESVAVLRRTFPSAYAMAGQQQQQQGARPQRASPSQSPSAAQQQGGSGAAHHEQDWGAASSDAALLEKSQQQQQQQQQKPAAAAAPLLSFDGLSGPAQASPAPSASPAAAAQPATANFFDGLGGASSSSKGSLIGDFGVSAARSPAPQAQQKPANAFDTLGLGINDMKPSTPKAEQQRPGSRPASAGGDALGLGIGDFVSSRGSSPAPPQKPAASPAPAPRADGLGINLDFNSFATSPGPAAQPAAAAAAAAAAPSGPQSMSDSFDSVFGAMPAQASSHSPVDDLQATFTMKSPPPSSCSPSGAGARLLSAAEVKAWASRGGRQGNMRALLSSLHEVLWEDSGWTPVSLADLVDQAKVREAYRKAVTVVHPDKVTGKDRQDVAQVVFTCLRESYDIFKKEMAAAKVSLAPAGTSSGNVD